MIELLVLKYVCGRVEMAVMVLPTNLMDFNSNVSGLFTTLVKDSSRVVVLLLLKSAAPPLKCQEEARDFFCRDGILSYVFECPTF